jgi:hypothetical protein
MQHYTSVAAKANSRSSSIDVVCKRDRGRRGIRQRIRLVVVQDDKLPIL